MWLGHWAVVIVPVMFVVDVQVLVLQSFMDVFVLVSLGEVQP